MMRSSLMDVPPQRLVFLALVAILVSLPPWVGARVLVAMQAEPPVLEASTLKGALEGARRARAREFAPTELRVAEETARTALSEYYRTTSQKSGFLRYDLVRAHLTEATVKADLAWSKARRRGASESRQAMQMIDEGRAVFRAAEAASGSPPIGSIVRKNLARARVSIMSAASRWRSGDYEAAKREATSAKTLANEVRRRASSFLEDYTSSDEARKWTHWVRETIALSRRTGDSVVLVDKLRHKCHLYRGGVLVRTYEADLGGTLWDKRHAGDRATPEGMYRVVQKRARGQTRYYKALLINYPNEEDRAQFAIAKRRGRIPRRAGIGGLIEIHGDGGKNEDWTLGCVALANRDMDELFRMVQVGTPVTIVGTISRSLPVSG